MQREVSPLEAIETRYPEQVAVAIARDARGKCNPIAVGWIMLSALRPVMMAMSIAKTRYSVQAIRHAREYVIAFASEQQAEEVRLFGTTSGRDMDKLAVAGTKVSPARRVDSLLMDEAVSNFECRLCGEMDSGDHVIFLGEVVAAHVSDRPRDRLYLWNPGVKLRGLTRNPPQ